MQPPPMDRTDTANMVWISAARDGLEGQPKYSITMARNGVFMCMCSNGDVERIRIGTT